MNNGWTTTRFPSSISFFPFETGAAHQLTADEWLITPRWVTWLPPPLFYWHKNQGLCRGTHKQQTHNLDGWWTATTASHCLFSLLMSSIPTLMSSIPTHTFYPTCDPLVHPIPLWTYLLFLCAVDAYCISWICFHLFLWMWKWRLCDKFRAVLWDSL